MKDSEVGHCKASLRLTFLAGTGPSDIPPGPRDGGKQRDAPSVLAPTANLSKRAGGRTRFENRRGSHCAALGEHV